MRLNSLKPAVGSKQNRKRVGRGIGSGHGKTCGRGHKGQKSRTGGKVAIGFEGGQMPLQRRLPKFGFSSRKAMLTTEIRLDQLERLTDSNINVASLKKADLIGERIQFVKVIATGELKKPVVLTGIKVTKGARSAIESAGGKIED